MFSYLFIFIFLLPFCLSYFLLLNTFRFDSILSLILTFWSFALFSLYLTYLFQRTEENRKQKKKDKNHFLSINNVEMCLLSFSSKIIHNIFSFCLLVFFCLFSFSKKETEIEKNEYLLVWYDLLIFASCVAIFIYHLWNCNVTRVRCFILETSGE